jgi:hypothetical protein
MKRKLLLSGLIISVLSLAFNTFIFNYFESKRNSYYQDIDYIKSRNIVMSTELSKAELSKFFSDFYINFLLNYLSSEKYKNDTTSILNLYKKRDASLIKALNYAYNSTITDPINGYDSSKVDEIKEKINMYNMKQAKAYYTPFSDNETDQILRLYNVYNKENNDLIQKNNSKVKENIKNLTKTNNYFIILKIIGFTLQITGLVLIFLKDFSTADKGKE